MSALEVIEEISKLPPEEQEKVIEFVRERLQLNKLRVSDEFKQAADRLFTTNAELFRKLAQ